MPLDQQVFPTFTPPKPYDPAVQETRDLINAQKQEAITASQFARQQKEEAARQQAEIARVLQEAPDQQTMIVGVRRINPKLADDMQKGLDEHSAALAKRVDDDFKHDREAMDFTEAALAKALKNPSSYPLTRSVLLKAYGNDPEKSPVLQQLPEQFDETRLSLILGALPESKSVLERQQAAAQRMFGKDPISGFYDSLSMASSPEEVKAITSMARETPYIPAQVIESVGEFSPENVQKWAQMALTPEQREQAKERQATQKRLEDAAKAAAEERAIDNKRADAQLAVSQGHLALARTSAAQGAAGAPGGLTDDDVEYVGTQYRILGPTGMPTRLGEASRNRIIHAAEQQVKLLGQTPAQAVQKQAAFKSDAAALTQMTKMRESASAFETKALGQADIIAELSPKVGRSDSPMLNDWYLAGKKEVAGDSPTAQLYNSIQTFSNEYAKIMEGSTGSVSASSVSARYASENLIKATMGQGTLKDVVALMKREMALTMSGYDATIDHITSKMGGAPAAAATPDANKPADLVYDPKTKTFKKGGG